jgi:hypothetical protein
MHHQFSVEHVQLIGKCVRTTTKTRGHTEIVLSPRFDTPKLSMPDLVVSWAVSTGKIGQLLTILRQFKKLVHSEIWHKLGINYVE